MALIKCPDCGSDVSDVAPACPKCGRPIAAVAMAPRPPDAAGDAPKSAKNRAGCGTVIAMFILAIFIYGLLNRADGPPRSTVVNPSAIDAKAAADCRKDLRCIAEKHLAAASVYCKAKIEARASHEAKWSDGMLDPAMSRYRWTAQPGGRVTYIGDKVSFQNGFGAYTPITYTCDFDIDADRPVDVNVFEGRLPHDD